MKLFHLSDLHLGKRLNECSLMEDQRHILTAILQMIDDEMPDALMICGDVYDKATPPAEAVTLFDDFLWEVSCRDVPVLVVSGNHDSAERLSFGSRIMASSHIYISRCYELGTPSVVLHDEYGPVSFHLLPFVKPIHVRRALQQEHPDEAEDISDYTSALRAAIDHMDVDTTQRNVLLAHQFVTGATRSESEEVSVGGLDDVSVDVFEPFDYVALGHLHSPQRVFKDTVRYCGTPLKYSFSETGQTKSVTVVQMGPKGDLSLRFLPLAPLHDLRKIRGTYQELMLKKNYENTNVEDYLHVTLTDEDDVPYAIDGLRTVYPNIMQLAYDNKRTQSSAQLEEIEHVEQLTPLELFEKFFAQQNNQPMDEQQRAYIQDAIVRIWREER